MNPRILIYHCLPTREKTMHHCPDCHQSVIPVTHGAGPAQRTLLLEPGGAVDTYAAVAEGRLHPEPDDRVFLSLASIEHRYVCPVAWQKRLAQQRSNAQAKRAQQEKASR
jgi:hypothetical protein